MTTKEKVQRTNVGTRHPQLYRALTPIAKLADTTALEEGLSPLLIELVKLRVSQINGCAFCLPAWRESDYFDEQERSALALAEYLTLIQDSHRNAGLYESAVAHLTSGQVSAVTWIVMVINTYNRIAISGAFPVAPGVPPQG
jgi:alkylhydroperoxidase family enzyme